MLNNKTKKAVIPTDLSVASSNTDLFLGLADKRYFSPTILKDIKGPYYEDSEVEYRFNQALGIIFEEDNFKALGVILQEGLDPNYKIRYSRRPQNTFIYVPLIFSAINHGALECVKSLIAQSADLKTKYPKSVDCKALSLGFYTISQGHEEILLELLQHDIDFKGTNHYKENFIQAYIDFTIEPDFKTVHLILSKLTVPQIMSQKDNSGITLLRQMLEKDEDENYDNSQERNFWAASLVQYFDTLPDIKKLERLLRKEFSNLDSMVSNPHNCPGGIIPLLENISNKKIELEKKLLNIALAPVLATPNIASKTTFKV